MKRFGYCFNWNGIKFCFWVFMVGFLFLQSTVYAQEKIFLSSGIWGGEVDIWDVHHGIMLDSIQGVNAWYMITTSDGTKLYTNNENDDIYITDLMADTLLANPIVSYDAYQLGSMALLKNDSLLLIPDYEMGYLFVWDVKADTLMKSISLNKIYTPQFVVISSDEKNIYLAGGAWIEKMEAASFTELWANPLPSAVAHLVISPDDSTIYTAGYYTTILNANTLDTVRTVSFNSDKVLLDTANHRLLGLSTTKFATIDLTTYQVDTIYDFSDTTYQFPVLRDMAFFSGTDSVLLVGPSGMLKLDTKTLQIAGRIDSVNYQRVYVWKAPAVLTLQDPVTQPDQFELYQNYPNPFNPVTTIRFQIQTSDWVKMEVFDLLGRRVRTLINQRLNSGVHQVQWDGKDDLGRNVASGVYFYRLNVGSHAKIRKMVLMK